MGSSGRSALSESGRNGMSGPPDPGRYFYSALIFVVITRIRGSLRSPKSRRNSW